MYFALLRIRVNVLIFGLLFIIGVDSVQAARQIDVKVFVDNVLVLRGYTFDTGKPDADEVWRKLVKIPLKPTGDFVKKYSNVNDAHLLLKEIPIFLSIDYGGMIQTKRLKLVRHTTKDGVDEWMIDPEHVRSFFSIRSIPRDEVSRLNDPKTKE